MSARILYRIAAVLLLLFALGHTLGFRQGDPAWGAGPVIGSMQSLHFNAQGFDRTYWDFFSGFGFFFSVFLIFAAVVAWQLGNVTATNSGAAMRLIAWALALCFVVVSVLNLKYGFTIPIVFSVLITVCLLAAAWFSPKPT